MTNVGRAALALVSISASALSISVLSTLTYDSSMFTAMSSIAL